MSFKPLYALEGADPRPQFLLKDLHGRPYGVVEHYNADHRKDLRVALLEFVAPHLDPRDRPSLWLDLDSWKVLKGHSRNLPDADFEAGLEAFIGRWSGEEKRLRRERCRRARFSQQIALAEKGYTVAYQELFPGELGPEDFPEVEVEGGSFVVDDQYLVQPGDFRNQVTLVLVRAQVRPGADGPGRADHARDRENGDPDVGLLFNWLFGEGYEIVHTRLGEEASHRLIAELTQNAELERIYRERLGKMRREAVLLGVKPPPYRPGAAASAEGSP